MQVNEAPTLIHFARNLTHQSVPASGILLLTPSPPPPLLQQQQAGASPPPGVARGVSRSCRCSISPGTPALHARTGLLLSVNSSPGTSPGYRDHRGSYAVRVFFTSVCGLTDLAACARCLAASQPAFERRCATVPPEGRRDRARRSQFPRIHLGACAVQCGTLDYALCQPGI